MRRFLAMAAATSGLLHGLPNACLVLSPGQTLHALTSSRRPACFLITVASGEQTQLAAEQPVDLTIRVSEAGEEAVRDGFEFGIETLTLLAPGRYRVEVRPVDAADGSSRTFSMSRRTVPLRLAESWRRAEISATDSKRSGKPEDIAESLLLWKKLGDASGVARTDLKQGDAFLAHDDSVGARTAYEDALVICAPLSDLRCVAEAANNSGYASFLIGDLDAASRRLREAAEHWRRLSLRLFEARTLNNFGLMFWQSGDFEQALKALDEARRILRGRDATVHAQILNNLGLCYQSLSENEKALAYFRSALSAFLVQHQPRHAARVRLNIGRSNMLLGKLERAEAILVRALTDATEVSDFSTRADVLNNLGQALLRLHRGDQARARLTEALALQRQIHSKRGEGIALHYLGAAASERGDTEAAREFFAEAARIRRESGLRDDASESVLAVAELEYHAGEMVGARNMVGQAIALIESLRSQIPSASLRATYYARKRRFFDLLTDIAMDSGSPSQTEEGFLASEQVRGRSLLDLLTGGAVAGVIPNQLLERRTNLRRQIEILSRRLTDAEPLGLSDPARRALDRDREGMRHRLQLLLSEDNQVEAEIRQTVHASAVGRPLSSTAELRNTLPADSAVLEYYLGERRSYLWVVQAGGIQSFRLPPRADIEVLASRTANRFGAIMDRRRSPQAQSGFEADLRRLSAVLLGPLAGLRLPPRLVFVLDGVLNRVPIAALRPPWAREGLGLSFEIVLTPSAAFLLAAKAPRPVTAFPRSALVIADPVFAADDPRLTASSLPTVRTESLPRLPFTGEVTALKALVPPERIRVLQGFDAALPNLRKLDLRDFAVLHFSTHAFIDDRIPELSRVALSLVDGTGRPVDGYLHPNQFGEFRLNRSIVVLSSCETALGKEVLGEGLAGFATSLFSAGASQLVVALTKVDAEFSAAFFAEAYGQFFGAQPQPQRMERALTKARRTLAHSTRWSDPYYWASFTVMGSLGEAR